MIRLGRSLGRFLFGSLLVVSAVACSGTAPMQQADAEPVPSDGGFIGGNLDSGIGLLFVVEPPFGETFSHDDNIISVSAARFTLMDLRLIGDAASGDSRTSKDRVELVLNSDEPVGVAYEEAPPGRYSHARATVVAFEIQGNVDINEEGNAEFEVEQESGSLPIEFSLDLNLDAGEALIVDVSVDLQKITEEIPFDELTIEDGSIEIEDDSEAMEKVEEKITEAFEVRD